MANNIEKHVWLIETIRSSGKLTFKEICSRWMENSELNPFGKSMHVRTMHRYQNEIRDMYGISICCDRSTNGYYIDYSGNRLASWLMNTVSVDNMIRENRSLHDRIVLDDRQTGEEFIPVITAAMKENRKISITYCRFDGREPYTTLLSPYFIKIFARRWYVIGVSERHPGETRTYALDRIRDIRPENEKFDYPKDFSPEEYFLNSFGIYHSNGTAEHIEIKVSARQREYLRTLPLHSSQKETETNEEYSVFSLYLCIDEDFIREIQRNGSDFEVLEPESLRKEIVSRTRQTLANYGEHN